MRERLHSHYIPTKGEGVWFQETLGAGAVNVRLEVRHNLYTFGQMWESASAAGNRLLTTIQTHIRRQGIRKPVALHMSGLTPGR
jgi:hypothetical protein